MKGKAQQLAEERYPYYMRPMVVEYTANKHADELRASFIAGYEADKWISFDEQDPPVNERILLLDNEHNIEVNEIICDPILCNGEFTHWQPLPSPPKTT
jgi:hypothetical protein